MQTAHVHLETMEDELELAEEALENKYDIEDRKSTRLNSSHRN